MSFDADVLVVGGGPVGLATAIEARLAGLTATVIEPREGAIDKACGEGLMPGALPELARLGVALEGRELHGVAYSGGGRRAEHRFSSGHGLGVRRTTLSDALADRATALGVARVAARVDEVRQDAVGVSVAGMRGRYLVAADGLHSSVRTLVGLDRPVGRRRRRFGVRQHFAVEPWTDLIEVHWTPQLEAYVTPVADDTVGVAVLGRARIDFDAALAGIPELASRLKDREPASSLRGAGSFPQRASRRVAGRVMLAGDASGYVDAITGEGIRVGLAQASAAIACIVADRPAAYEREWSRRTRDFRTMTAGLVTAASSPVRGAIVPTAVALPALFGAVVERLAR